MIPRDLFQNSHDLGLEGGEKWESQTEQPGQDLMITGWGKVTGGYYYSIEMLSNKKLGGNGGKIYTSPSVPDAEFINRMLFINRNRAHDTELWLTVGSEKAFVEDGLRSRFREA